MFNEDSKVRCFGLKNRMLDKRVRKLRVGFVDSNLRAISVCRRPRRPLIATQPRMCITLWSVVIYPIVREGNVADVPSTASHTPLQMRIGSLGWPFTILRMKNISSRPFPSFPNGMSSERVAPDLKKGRGE